MKSLFPSSSISMVVAAPSFVMATVMLIVLGLVASDRLHLLTFISTDLVAGLILIFGLILFLFKLWQWKRDKIEKKM